MQQRRRMKRLLIMACRPQGATPALGPPVSIMLRKMHLSVKQRIIFRGLYGCRFQLSMETRLPFCLCSSSDQADRRSALAALAEELGAATAALREREDEVEALRAVSIRGEAALQACMAQLQARMPLATIPLDHSHACSMQSLPVLLYAGSASAGGWHEPPVCMQYICSYMFSEC